MGQHVVFVRGHATNNVGWVANPTSDPDGAERAIWAARTRCAGPAWRLAEGSNPVLSPDGRSVLYMKEGQIYRARVTSDAGGDARRQGRGAVHQGVGTEQRTALVARWLASRVRRAIARRTASSRVYDFKTQQRELTWPPVWIATPARRGRPTARRIAFLRRPGAPFGRSRRRAAAAACRTPRRAGRRRRWRRRRAAAAPAARRAGTATPATTTPAPGAPAQPPAAGRQGGRGGRGGGGDAPIPQAPRSQQQPGLYRGLLPGGHTLAMMLADARDRRRRKPRCWHPAPDDRVVRHHQRDYVGRRSLRLSARSRSRRTNRTATTRSTSRARWRPPVQLTTTEASSRTRRRRAVERRQDALLLHQHQRHRPPPHLRVPVAGGTPHADHDGRRHRERAGAARVRQTDRGAQRRCEAADSRWRCGRQRDASERRRQGPEVIYPSLGGIPARQRWSCRRT